MSYFRGDHLIYRIRLRWGYGTVGNSVDMWEGVRRRGGGLGGEVDRVWQKGVVFF